MAAKQDAPKTSRFNREASFEGFATLPKRDPGLYIVNLTNIAKGTKFAGKDKEPDPTIDITYKIVRAVEVFNDVDKATLKGKEHVHQIKLVDMDDDKLNKIIIRIGHNLTKIGITKDQIYDLADATVQDVDNLDAFVEGLNGLLTEEVKKTNMQLLINANNYQGRWTSDVPANPTFAAEEKGELPIPQKQKALNYQYFEQVKNVKPTSGGIASGASADDEDEF